MKNDLLRKLPKVDELLKNSKIIDETNHNIRNSVVDALRDTLDDYRNKILSGEIENFNIDEIVNSATDLINKRQNIGIRRVVNATGVIIHTNLGRSILPKEAVDNVVKVAKYYNNLEYDVEKAQRGSRYSHVEDILKKITGAEAAMVVNNNAAAVMLVLNTLCSGKEAIVSRGELVEIGGSFRIPDVMEFSGAKLREVGTTNRTHTYDYENNINESTGVLLKVHTSNFKISGFTEEVSIEELSKIGKKNNIFVVEDIGSGVLVDFSKYGFSYEPTVQDSIRKGADVVTFSGDKMLGGPQAGIIVGTKECIEKMKKNQLTRALRIDKMTLAALSATLKYYLDEREAINNIPTLNMILSSAEVQKKRAMRLKKRLDSFKEYLTIKVEKDYSMVGGGSMPEEKINSYVLKISSNKCTAQQLESKLRNSEIPVIVRVSNNEVLIDVRTILDEEFDIVVKTFKELALF